MKQSKGMAPGSPREYAKLLESWGFQQEKGQGGHIVMIYNGTRVQISAPGRHMPTPYRALRKAAEIVGVDLTTFLQGPTKEVVRQEVQELTFREPCGCVVREDGADLCNEHQPKENSMGGTQTEDVVEPENEGPLPRRKSFRRKRGPGRPPTVIAEVTGARGRSLSGFEVPDSDVEIEIFEDEDVRAQQEYDFYSNPDNQAVKGDARKIKRPSEVVMEAIAITEDTIAAVESAEVAESLTDFLWTEGDVPQDAIVPPTPIIQSADPAEWLSDWAMWCQETANNLLKASAGLLIASEVARNKNK